MKGKVKKVKNGTEYIYPITVSDGVYVYPNKTLKTKLIEMDAAISQAGQGTAGGGGTVSITNSPVAPYSYYTPTNEQGALDPAGKVYKNWTAAELYAKYDALVTANPKYVRREIAPYKDMSDTYELRRYIFEPEDGYEKTIFIQAGIHGNELASKLGLMRIVQLICEDWQDSPQLTYMRKNVRMVVIPMGNPWGHDRLIMTNANNSANTGGSNGVNCNRNYDAFWGQTIMSAGADHNGATPFSENETKWVRDTINTYGAENFHYGFDFHDAGTASVQGDFWINYNTFHKSSLNVTRPLVWYLADKYITGRAPFIWHDKDTSTSGVFPVWAGRVMGIPSSTVEHCYNGSVAATFDKNFMTQAVETYLNAVLANTLAEHKTPVFKSDKTWFNLEWWKCGGDHVLNTGMTFAGATALWDNLTTKYPKYAKKSATFVTSSDGNQVYHYILSPKAYKKTILVVGGRTEPNREPFNFSIAMLRLADLLCTHGNKDEHLAYLRNNVRMVFVPYLEMTTKYLNSAGYWAADGTPTLGQVNVSNIVSIMDTIGTIDGVIYQRELNKTDIFNSPSDDSFTLASQDTTDRTDIDSYVEHLKAKRLNAAYDRTATAEYANYVFNKKNINCVRIDTGIDHKMYEAKKFQFDDQYGDVAVSVDFYLKLNHEIARRITNIVNVAKLMSK